jgi:hypothetical protein
MPNFRADQVDMVVWRWTKSILADPEALAQGLWEIHRERERESSPVRERLNVVDDLLTDNRTQLERLLDLYLLGDFTKDVLIDRKVRLEETIFALERERSGLAAHLQAQLLTTEQIQTIQSFAAKVGENLEAMDGDLAAMRALIAALDVQVTLVVENGQKFVYTRCIVGESSCSVSQTIDEGNCQLAARRSNSPRRLPMTGQSGALAAPLRSTRTTSRPALRAPTTSCW